MDQREIFMDALRSVAKLCAASAMTAPKSGGQLFLKGAHPFIETVILEDKPTLKRLAEWLRARGEKLKEPIWFRDADTAEKLDIVLFIGLARWYPPQYDCGACGYPTCAEFSNAAPKQRQETPGNEDWEFPGPICQIRCIDLGIAVGSAAKIASMNNIDTRCQTRIAAAARHLGVIQADLAVALSMSVSHKNIFFDKKKCRRSTSTHRALRCPITEDGKNMDSAPQIPSVLTLIGNTPLIPLRFEPEGLTILAKCEFLNPSGSIKDRFALAVLTDAQRRGVLRPDSVVLECTSGNTGIALAMAGAALGLRVTILMSKSASVERRQIMRHFGAELILFEANAGYRTGIDIARDMAAKDSRYFLPSQFDNPLNAADHEHITAQEIVRQTPAPIDCFVAGYGTGATLAGVGRGLKKAFPNISIFAMEPAEAAMLAGECPCCHAIEGVAGGFLPPLLSAAPLDGAIKIKSGEALGMTRRLSRDFGLLVGTSSGANVAAALKKASTLPSGATVVTVLCDRAERYFSTRLFEEGEGRE